MDFAASVATGQHTDREIVGNSPPEIAKALTHSNSSANDTPLLPGDSLIIVKAASSGFGQTVVVREPDWNGLVKVETEAKEIKSFKREDLQLQTGAETPRNEQSDITAHATQDVWAFGLLFFQAFARRPLFLTNHDGCMASVAETEKLASWSQRDLRELIWCAPLRLIHSRPPFHTCHCAQGI